MAESRERRPRVPIATAVTRTQWLTPQMVRVRVGGDGLSRFRPSPYADSYVKLVFLHPQAPRRSPVDLDALRADLPGDRQPRLRSYTVRAYDPVTHELTLDFVVHGDAGVAGPWAAAAKPGDELLLLGPGGAYNPDLEADWHLLVADESALPAVAVALERLTGHAVGRVFVEVDGPWSELPLAAPAGVTVTWVHRGRGRAGDALVRAVTGAALPEGRAHAFVHGEAGSVKEIRRFLRVDRRLPAEQLSISGYWRLGQDDEGWRAGKAEWNRQVEAVEAAAGVR